MNPFKPYQGPPFTADEIDRLARALVEHRAHGSFFGEESTAACFRAPLMRWSPAGLLEALEKGMIYVAGFLPEGVVFNPLEGLPKVPDFVWLDASHTRKVLERAYQMEALVNNDLTKLGKKGDREISNAIALYETQRRQELPNLRRLIGRRINAT